MQGYNTLSNVGIEALTGFLGAFLNVRFIAPATAGWPGRDHRGRGDRTARRDAHQRDRRLEVMGIRSSPTWRRPGSSPGWSVVIPIYTVAVLMSFLATRFGTTIIYGRSRGVYDHYFTTFLQIPSDLMWSFVEALAMAAA